jgi:hypothetical protein
MTSTAELIHAAAQRALYWAEKAEEDRTLYVDNSAHMQQIVEMSRMWSDVAVAFSAVRGDNRRDWS